MTLVVTAPISASTYWVLRTVATENERDAQAIWQEIAWIGPVADGGAPTEAGEPRASEDPGSGITIAANQRAELELSC